MDGQESRSCARQSQGNTRAATGQLTEKPGLLGGPLCSIHCFLGGHAEPASEALEKPPLPLSCFLGSWAERPPTPRCLPGPPGWTLPAPRARTAQKAPAAVHLPSPPSVCLQAPTAAARGLSARPPTATAAGSGGKTGKERLWIWSCWDRAQPGTELTALRPSWFTHTKQTGPSTGPHLDAV